MSAESFSSRVRPDGPEDLIRGNGNWSTDVLLLLDAVKATISELDPKDPRSPSSQQAQDADTDASTSFSQHRTSINLIGSRLSRWSEILDTQPHTTLNLQNRSISVKAAGIPRVEEWKSIAVNSENSSVTAADLDGHVCDPGTLFRECAPTNERLMKLRDAWIDPASLHLRLLYCQPFNLVFQQRGKLIMERHHDLAELLQQEKLEDFFAQVVRSWPESFGELKSTSDAPCFFRWHAGESRLDDGTGFLCRVARRHEGQQGPVKALISPATQPVDVFPTNNIIWQIMPRVTNSVLTMRTVAFLESLFAPTQETNNLPSYGSLSDWFSIQTTKPVLRSIGRFGAGDWFCVQLNLRACIPDENGNRNKHFKNSWGISPLDVGLPLNRQTAQIPDLSQGGNTTAIEYLISVSMVMRKRTSMNSSSALKYDVVTWLDYKTDFKTTRDREVVFPVLSHNVNDDLGLEDCGAGGEAVLEFIIVLAKSIDHWKLCWDHMIDKVDDIISVQLQDTLDRKRWNSLMFDDSLQLSEQYFTILQLLRICQDWIGETERGIKNLSGELIQKLESWKAWQQEHARNDLSQWPLDMTTLRHNVTCLQDFFGTRASPLWERIRIKKEEVSSLQDALLSTSSLRETLKAKTLNLYIGVFTTVTVFFTPLGFIATLWTIPFLQGNLDNPIPKGFKETFVAVPMLTYILSGFIILYF
ncbi:hypothetical protein F5Y08DRAFT_81053 [Xylaria arbuscula]|nr:hypothetical protein F5Y08DRAFT_81053 [Xylaria arbuscula]